MGSYYECSLSVSISVHPKDSERAKQSVLDAVIPVLEEMGSLYDGEELAKALESHESGEGENKEANIYLYVSEVDYKPDWDEDENATFNQWTGQIAKKLSELPLKDGSVNLYGYWSDREPDISSYVYLPKEEECVCSEESE